MVAEPSNKARIDPELKKKCNSVVDVPEKDLGLTEVARLWAIDRTSLGECAPRHNSLVDSIKVIEK